MNTAPFDRDDAVDRALAAKNNTPNTCQLWTRLVFGVPSVGDFDGDGASDAEDGWKSEPAAYKHPGDRRPPAGVPVSYGGGSHDNGHRAVSLGNGMIRSTDAAGWGHIATVPLDWPEKAWGLTYLGWSDTCDGWLIPKPPTNTRVVTANVPIRKLDAAQQASALTAILDRHPHYAGLQEWGGDALLMAAKKRGYGFARAKGGPPILFDLGRTGLLHVHARRLARAEFVGHLIGRKDRLPVSVATEAVFEDDELGEVAVIDAHLTAEVQSAGGYREDAAHWLRVQRHKRERRRLRRRAQHHRDKGRHVFVTVDGNFDGLKLRPLTPCWAGRRPLGTLGNRTVDVVFATARAEDVDTFATGSDHRAVIATY